MALRRSITLGLFATLSVCGLASSVLAQATNLGRFQDVVTGLSSPLYVVSPPGDDTRLFIVEQGGRIRLTTRADASSNWSTTTTIFLDVGSLLTPNSGTVSLTGCFNTDCNNNTACVQATQQFTLSRGGEQGLLGLAFAPDYATSGTFYINYVAPRGAYAINDSCPSSASATDIGRTVVARYQRSAGNANVADAGSAQTVIGFDQPFTNHNGGCLQFGPDGFLYIAVGDGGSGNDPQNNALDPNDILGKLLRLDVSSDAFPDDPNRSYAIPATNPYATSGGLPEIFARGLRNTWRYSFDRFTGDLLLADVGQDVQEEVNFVPAGTGAGLNFGWRVREGTRNTGLSAGGFDISNLTAPVHTYTHGGGAGQGFSITGGYVYRGAAIRAYRGKYFFADFVNRRIWSFRPSEGAISEFADNYAGFNPPSPAVAVQSIASWGEDNQGELYIAQLNGRVRKLVPFGTQPNPVDVNFDGVVNADDLSDFITFYFSGDQRSDFNLDNIINSDDLSDFITAYFSN